ncbi:ABC transporter ATP-binding protein [Clostridium sp.]|uniref:ABC transporter ATP-binding protein n=1 Tax=Clostridium sp. TaxID=1506 RepID=UPI0032167570
MSNFNLFTKKALGILDIIRIPVHYCPFYSISIAVVSFFGGVVPTLSLLAVSYFINSSIKFFTEGSGAAHIKLSVLAIVLCSLYSSLSPLLMEYLNTKLENSLRENFFVSLIGRVASLKYEYFEDDLSLDLISRVSRQPETQCVKSYGQVLGAFSLILKIIGIMGVLLFKVAWAALAIAFIAIPTFRIAIRGGKENYEANRESEKHIRKAGYLSEILIGRNAAKERTLFNYSNKINDSWHKQYEVARNLKFKASLKWLKESEIGGILTSLLIAVIILILVFPLKRGLLSIGLFISIVNSTISLIPDLAWQLPEYTEAIAQSKEYLEDFTSLLSLKYKNEYLCVSSENPILVNRIEFRNVTFRYPGTKRDILKNLNLVIERGKHYALVGANGSGKTTITKLLTGLYEEFEGDILINDISIKMYSQEKLKSMFAVVYQDFAKYEISLKDNIALGNVNGYSTQRFQEAIEESGLIELVQELPRGIDSHIGRIIKDSLDLSGGQWQRIAMARTLVSNASLRILDEPTAALDPVSESRLYENFEKINHGKTTLLISHRLASTKLADVIYVIEDGAVSEHGNFDELMTKNGYYAEMFHSQRRWYENEN